MSRFGFPRLRREISCFETASLFCPCANIRPKTARPLRGTFTSARSRCLAPACCASRRRRLKPTAASPQAASVLIMIRRRRHCGRCWPWTGIFEDARDDAARPCGPQGIKLSALGRRPGPPCRKAAGWRMRHRPCRTRRANWRRKRSTPPASNACAKLSSKRRSGPSA